MNLLAVTSAQLAYLVVHAKPRMLPPRICEWFCTPHLLIWHQTTPTSKVCVPKDLSLLTGDRVITAVGEDGSVTTIHDSPHRPRTDQLPDVWEGAIAYRTTRSKTMNSKEAHRNLKVPMVCCKSSVNEYRTFTSPMTDQLKPLNKHVA